jgi:hypothetical protein
VIYAFDPGKITGVATWDDEAGFWSSQFTVEELYEFVDDACERIGYAQIEKFTISAQTIRKTPESEPLDVIGYLKYAAWRCGFDIGWTKPPDVMATFTDAALKKAGMHVPGRGHANDAARHLAWYLVKNRYRPASDFLV